MSDSNKDNCIGSRCDEEGKSHGLIPSSVTALIDDSDGSTPSNSIVTPRLDARCSGKEEVAIQTNAQDIERSSGQLPARQRFVPLKFSDYRIFANNIKEEDEEEEEEDENFTPKEKVTKRPLTRTDKPKKRRGRPRKHEDKESPDGPVVSASLVESMADGRENVKKHSIMKVASGFKCCLCSKIFSLRGNAKAHLITHTDDKPFLCDFEGCGKSLRTKEALRRHKLSHLGIKTYECTECHKMFSCNFSLQEHVTLHTGERPLTCHVCGMKFRQNAVLKRHLTTHSNHKPFECPVCGKTFSLKVYVRSHMKTHTGERPFTCDLCNKSFSHASDLNRHKIIHTGKKPYECSVCFTRYSDPSSRRRHEREHQTKEQYVCHLCKKQFPRAGQLRVHLVKEHTSSTVDGNSMTFKDNTPWGNSSGNPSEALTCLQPDLGSTGSDRGIGGATAGDEDDGVVKAVHIVLDSSCTGQIESGKGAVAMASSDSDFSLVDGGVQTMVMEIPTGGQHLTVLPTNGTYKVIGSTEGNQIYELQVEKDGQGPLQMSEGEMKICLSDLKLTDGLVAYVQDGDTVTIMEQSVDNLACGDESARDFVLEKNGDQECLVGKCVDEIPNEKLTVTKMTNSIKNFHSYSDKRVKATAVFESPSGKPVGISGGEEVTDDEHVKRREVSDPDNGDVACPSQDSNGSESDGRGQGQVGDGLEGHPSVTSSVFIQNPDLTSQDYYNWLSSFSEGCKSLRLPLTKDVFQKISQVQKTLSDFMATPTGVIMDKNNFKILLGITHDLSQVTSSHLSLMYSNMNKL